MHSRRVLGVVFNIVWLSKNKSMVSTNKGYFGIARDSSILYTKMLRKTSIGSSRWTGKLSCPWEKLFPKTMGLKMSYAAWSTHLHICRVPRRTIGRQSAGRLWVYNILQLIPVSFIYLSHNVSHRFSIGILLRTWLESWDRFDLHGSDRFVRGSSLIQGLHDLMIIVTIYARS